jgi:hypothetical protein
MNMVIEVSYQTVADAKNPYSYKDQPRYYENDTVPSRGAVAQKLKSASVDFDENSMANRACKEDAETMRKAGFTVLKF